MADRMVAKSLKKNRKHQRRSTIRILEEAVHLLRLAPGNLLPHYYIGSLPFILGLLYFWADMSRNAYAAEHCAVASLGMALLFIWMKSWQTVFASKAKAIIENKPDQRWPLRRVVSTVAYQSFIQASGFVVLPIALFLMLPFGWCYAFYQNATVLGSGDPLNLNAICQRSWQQAKLWPKQNHILISIFFIFGCVVFLNLASSFFLLPYLLKILIGVDTVFTLSGINLLNTSFWAVTSGFTYLCMDPVVKTAYVLRCHYGESITSGGDIRIQLSRFLNRVNKVVSSGLVFMVLWSSLAFASQHQAITTPAMPASHTAVSPDALDQSIEKVLSQRDFAWRLPREKIQKDEAEYGPVAEAFDWLMRQLKVILKKIWEWFEAFLDWLSGFLPKAKSGHPASSSGWKDSVRLLLVALLLLAVIALVFFLYRFWQRRQSTPLEIASEAVPSVPDIADEGVQADELPSNRWLNMARELLNKGSFRLATRALYLTVLAYLAELDLLKIEIYKSNRDYERELRRRAHENTELLMDFTHMVELFDWAWYGMHDVSRSDVENYAAIQERIMAIAV